MSAPYYRVGQYYYDTGGKKLYRCKTAGDKTSSVWEQVGTSGSTVADFYDNTQAWNAGAIVQVLTTLTVGGVIILPGTYVLRQGLNVLANATDNQVPQYPYPTSGTIYWLCISMGITVVNTCDDSGSATAYINSSGPF